MLIIFDEHGQSSAGTARRSVAPLRRERPEQPSDRVLAFDDDDLVTFGMFARLYRIRCLMDRAYPVASLHRPRALKCMTRGTAST